MNARPESHPNLLASHLAELSLDQCIKCNICTTVCPVSGVSDLFPGPKYEAPQAGRFRGSRQPTPDHSVDYCSGCRACNMACPTGVKITEMNARARAEIVSQGGVDPRRRLRNNLVARTELIGKLGQPVAPLANAVLANRLVRKATQLALGIHQDAPLPSFSKQRFMTWFKKHQPADHLTRKVVYFHGCSTQYYEPRVGRAAVYVLENNGFEVIVPPQNCCGLPLLSNGEFPAARRYHESNVRNLAPYAKQGIPIVGTSTSCTLTLKEEAPELLDLHDPDTELVARMTFDLNEFLLQLLDEGSLKQDFHPIPLALPYHAPCQYRAHRLGKPALEVLNLIPDLHMEDSHATCCGIAGTYGYKEEKYEIAMQVGETLFDFINSFDSPIAVCDSETCRWQITHGTGKPAIHPIELVAAAYGFPAEGALAEILKN
jgi:glycerol-3-phosphate dehydrogenase subunit C